MPEHNRMNVNKAGFQEIKSNIFNLRMFLKLYIFLFIVVIQGIGSIVLASDNYSNMQVPGPNDVVIAPNAILIPQGRILLVNNKKDYCAIKFTKIWTDRNRNDLYANYESYYQGDKSGDFSKQNVKIKKGKLSDSVPRGIGRFSFSFGDINIECVGIKLQWSGKGWVYFYSEGQDQGDYGIKLAPTIWTSRSQINIFDPRVKWYKFNSKRKDKIIPIDQLWE